MTARTPGHAPILRTRRLARFARLVRLVVAPLVALTLTASVSDKTPAETPAETPIVAGMPLEEALRVLEARGLPLVWSSRAIAPTATVLAPPAATAPRAVLDELLAPHGLIARDGPGGSLVIGVASAPAPAASLAGTVRSRSGGEPIADVVVRFAESGREATTDREGRFRFDPVAPGRHALELRRPGYVIETVAGVVARAGETAELELALTPAPFAGDEIVVQPSRAAVLRAEPASAIGLERDEVLALPHLGNDVLRALEVLPGVASNDVTAQFHVRGGRRDEVLVTLDGQELYEAFHLRDFDSALSVVAASNLTGVHLSTGAFPADYGDRMGGVLELSTEPPPEPGRHRLAASLLAVEAGAARAGESGSWQVHARNGTARLAREVLDREEPDYRDLYGRWERSLDERQTLRLHGLGAEDRYRLVEEDDDEAKTIDTAYDVRYLWATHQRVLGARAFVDSALSWSESERDRHADERDDEKRIRVADRRWTRVVALNQSWNVDAGARHQLELGGVVRRFETDFDYFAVREFTTPLVALRSEPRDGVTRLDREFEDDHWGAFAADRWRLTDDLTVELGLRHDDHSGVDDAVTSPRLHLAWAGPGDNLWRLGWGRYAQSQRPYELAVEDAERAPAPIERSEHRVLGWERLFERPARRGPTALRIELYRRTVENPRPRYENLLEPFDAFPEGELDRHRFAPTEARAEGVELFLRGRLGARLDGWLDYAWAKSEDRIDGRWQPRLIDQRHTLNFNLRWRLGESWTLDLAGLLHSGRPTTAVGLESTLEEPAPDDGEGDDEGDGDDEVELVPVLGPINGARLADYARLDLRLARGFALARGRLTFHLDVQNLLDRENAAGFSVELDDEEGELVFDPERWPGLVASAGVVWEF